MKQHDLTPDDAQLRALLRESPPSPSLPPRFQESVWQRVEHDETRAETPARATWLEVLANWTLRPRLALASIATVLIAGLLLGALSGVNLARQDAQTRYLAAVAPNALR